MILFCDEDIGTKVPDALRLVGYKTFSMKQKGWLSSGDTDWLTKAGQSGWLAFSSNKRMLRVARERATIISEKVGIVFLTSGEEYLPNVLRLLLVKWSWLELINDTEPRPFAFSLYPNGRVIRQPIS